MGDSISGRTRRGARQNPTFGFGIANIAENLRAHAASSYREWLAREFPGHTRGGRRATYSDELQVWIPEAPAEASFSTWAAGEGIRFLETSPPEPFFLTVSFVDPHHPFAPPEPYASMYDPADVPLPRFTPGELDDKPPHFLDGHTGKVDPVLGLAAGQARQKDLPVGRVDLRQVDDRLWGRLVGHYYGMISLIDAQVGRLLSALRETGLDERTIVIFTSDHGELLGDHGLLFKGPHHYDPLLRVPAIVRVPGEPEPGRRHGALVEQIDLTSSILALCDVEPPPSMQGHSLVDELWSGGRSSRESVLIERKDLYWCLDMKTLRTHDWKLTHYASADFGELIDLKNDPGELVNLWDDRGYRAVKDELLAHLLDRLSGSEDPIPSPVALA